MSPFDVGYVWSLLEGYDLVLLDWANAALKGLQARRAQWEQWRALVT